MHYNSLSAVESVEIPYHTNVLCHRNATTTIALADGTATAERRSILGIDSHNGQMWWREGRLYGGQYLGFYYLPPVTLWRSRRNHQRPIRGQLSVIAVQTWEYQIPIGLYLARLVKHENHTFWNVFHPNSGFCDIPEYAPAYWLPCPVPPNEVEANLFAR